MTLRFFYLLNLIAVKKLMYFSQTIITLAVVIFLAAATELVLAEDELDVGRSAAGQLKVDIDFPQPFELAVSVFPGMPGYATGELGVHSASVDDPTNDFFQLSPGADFRFILLAKDSGMEVWNDHGSAFMQTNETFFIGTAPFDTHPIWNITSGTPGNEYSLTLKLRDLNGVYPDSAPFVLSFTAVQIHYPLAIKQADPQHATLSWTTNAAGWELQSAASVAATNWATITNVPALVGTNFSLSITTAERQQFFRLHKL